MPNFAAVFKVKVPEPVVPEAHRRVEGPYTSLKRKNRLYIWIEVQISEQKNKKRVLPFIFCRILATQNVKSEATAFHIIATVELYSCHCANRGRGQTQSRGFLWLCGHG